jgi:glycosyltransferase involved in cell wall biosynthesis
MMRVACTGFVSATEGSVAAANVLLLNRLLDQDFEIDFFSKPSFVDPRPIVGNKAGFRFVSVNNQYLDLARRKFERVPLISAPAGAADAYSYNRMLVRWISQEHRQRRYDLCLWLGDYARGAVLGLPTISFPQGPPGTDARSVLARYSEIRRLVGSAAALKWQLLARLRLSKLGRPPLRCSDHFIVGSRQSSTTLQTLYAIEPDRISVLPYPIDLELFKPDAPIHSLGAANSASTDPARRPPNLPLRVLWLGRIVPRKRLDILLDGASRAIGQGVDLTLTVIGSSGFVGGYEKMIGAFPYPQRLQHWPGIDRSEVPGLLNQHDVLAQPSEEENFGSSVAEAQACGLPVIVGRTNGNSDYLCDRDIHLTDERPETFTAALVEMARRKASGTFGDPKISRLTAEQHFDIKKVTDCLACILATAVQNAASAPASIGRRAQRTSSVRIDGQSPELVSVIIPAFNAAGNIRQTLDSVRAQTYETFEAIVIDDGSSDGTSAIVEEFARKDPRFRLVRQENRGVGDARNAGIRKASGQYIAPLDADDLWFPEKLEKQVGRMKQCGSETGLVYCWSTFIDRHGDFVDKAYHVAVEGRLRHACVLRNIVENASIPLFRANVFEKVGLYLTRDEQGGAQGCEDWDLALRIAEISTIGAVPECLVAYRLTGNSMSADPESMAASFATVMRRARQRNCDLPPTTFRWSCGNFYRYLANRCYYWGYYSRFLRYLKEAIVANPVLLLDAAIYSSLLKSVFDIVTGTARRDLAPGRVSPDKAEERVYLRRSKRSKILNMIFDHIESKHWAAALNDQS